MHFYFQNVFGKKLIGLLHNIFFSQMVSCLRIFLVLIGTSVDTAYVGPWPVTARGDQFSHAITGSPRPIVAANQLLLCDRTAGLRCPRGTVSPKGDNSRGVRISCPMTM